MSDAPKNNEKIQWLQCGVNSKLCSQHTDLVAFVKHSSLQVPVNF